MPLVSVILPTCDRPALLPRALDSILRQSWSDIEVVVVDSNRHSPQITLNPDMACILADPRIVLVSSVHVFNAAGARNAGLSVARGDWITYLDDDDVYHPDKVGAQVALATETGAPLVLCGYTVVMPKRKRTRQTSHRVFSGDALLTRANWGTPMLFHRRDPALHFDESLRAGEDEVFAHAFLTRHNVTSVPNCATSLVDVFPQLDAARVHGGEQVWKAYQATWRLTHGHYSRAAQRSYLAMGCLVRAQSGHGDLGHFARCALAVLRTRGLGGWRLVANATAHRLRLFRRWVVS